MRSHSMPSDSLVARSLAALLAAAAITVLAPAALGQGTTSFTYQGSLMDNGAPANGEYDIQARLFTTEAGAIMVGAVQCFNDVQVVDGLFNIYPSFSSEQYHASPRYLELAVRRNTGLDCGSIAGFTILGPRTRLMPTPFAIESLNARSLGTVDAANYARTDTNAFFYGHVTMYKPYIISMLDSGHICGTIISDSSVGTRLMFKNASSTPRTWTIGATGSGSVEGGARFSIWDETLNAPRLVIAGASGNVGVGTSNPNQRLDVIDGAFRVATSAAGSGAVIVSVTAQEHGLLSVRNSANNHYVYAGQSQASGAANVGAQLLVCDSSGASRGGFQINSANNCTMFAQVKSFMVENPDDPTTDLYYACVEGPEAAMYVRGTAHLVNGEAIVTLPKHFTAMALLDGMTVQITPLSADCNGIAVVKKGTDVFAVKELMRGTSNAAFDWEVKAVRSGFEDFEVIRPKGIMNPPKPQFIPVN